jgi:hypothetical protein
MISTEKLIGVENFNLKTKSNFCNKLQFFTRKIYYNGNIQTKGVPNSQSQLQKVLPVSKVVKKAIILRYEIGLSPDNYFFNSSTAIVKAFNKINSVLQLRQIEGILILGRQTDFPECVYNFDFKIL